MSQSTPRRFCALLFLLFVAAGQVLAQADLSLSLAQSVEAPQQYTNYTVVVTVRNDGPETATGVRVSVPSVDGAVYRGGGEALVTQGSFEPYSTQVWTVGSLAPGRRATLRINLFLLAEQAPAYYAQVTAADQDDPDSTPGNGTAPTVNEDDEASTAASPPNPGVPDLRLRNLRLPTATVAPGGALAFVFDLANVGDGDAEGDFFVHAYVSRDRVIGDDDIRSGAVETGGFTKGTESLGVRGTASTGDLAPGDYFLIVRADDSEAIAESDEGNNVDVEPFTISDDGTTGGGPTECGFVADVDGVGTNATAYLSGEDYVIQEILPTGRLGRTVLSPTGEVLSTSTFDFPAAASRFPERVVLEGNRYALLSSVGGVPEVVLTDRDGAEALRFTFDPAAAPDFELPEGPAAAFTFDDIAATSTGYVATGVYRPSPDPSASGVHIVRFDERGRFVSGKVLITGRDFVSFRIDAVTEDGVVFAPYFTADRFRLTLRIGADNEITSANASVDNLTSTNVGGLRLSADGDLLYYSLADDLTLPDGSRFPILLLAFRTSDFAGAFGFRPELLAPGTARAFGLVGAPLPLADNGVAIAYEYTEEGSGETRFRVARIDDAGEIIFFAELADELELSNQSDFATGLLETPAGDLLFVTSNGQVFQLRADGSLQPDCGGEEPPTGGSVDLTLSVASDSPAPPAFTNNVVTYTLENEGDGAATGVRVRIPTPAGTVLTGGSEFVASRGTFVAYGNQVWDVGRLDAGGTATLAVSYFSLGDEGYDVYGEVVALNEADADSTPDNGNGTTAREDDEAALSLRPARTAALRLSPNPLPMGQTLQIDLGTKIRQGFAAQLIASDLMGRVVIRREVDFRPGAGVLEVDLSGLVPGVYVVAIPEVAVTSQRLVVR